MTHRPNKTSQHRRVGPPCDGQDTIPDEDAERFWDKVARCEPSECWEWEAYTDRDGYGRFSLNGRKERAHRVALRLDGRYPAGQVVRHTCDNPGCVNPAHLKAGSQRENMRDRGRRNREPCGERNGQSRLTREDVKKIRAADRPSKELANRFGTTASNIREIRSGRSWRHLE